MQWEIQGIGQITLHEKCKRYQAFEKVLSLFLLLLLLLFNFLLIFFLDSTPFTFKMYSITRTISALCVPIWKQFHWKSLTGFFHIPPFQQAFSRLSIILKSKDLFSYLVHQDNKMETLYKQIKFVFYSVSLLSF